MREALKLIILIPQPFKWLTHKNLPFCDQFCKMFVCDDCENSLSLPSFIQRSIASANVFRALLQSVRCRKSPLLGTEKSGTVLASRDTRPPVAIESIRYLKLLTGNLIAVNWSTIKSALGEFTVLAISGPSTVKIWRMYSIGRSLLTSISLMVLVQWDLVSSQTLRSIFLTSWITTREISASSNPSTATDVLCASSLFSLSVRAA